MLVPKDTVLLPWALSAPLVIPMDIISPLLEDTAGQSSPTLGGQHSQFSSAGEDPYSPWMRQSPSLLLTYRTMPALGQMPLPASPTHQVLKPHCIVINGMPHSAGDFIGIKSGAGS